jgi:hypothetical protein
MLRHDLDPVPEVGRTACLSCCGKERLSYGGPDPLDQNYRWAGGTWLALSPLSDTTNAHFHWIHFGSLEDRIHKFLRNGRTPPVCWGR